MPLSITCNFSIGQNRRMFHINEAIAHRDGVGTFMANRVHCDGRVRAHRASNNEMAAHFEHMEGNQSVERTSSLKNYRCLQ